MCVFCFKVADIEVIMLNLPGNLLMPCAFPQEKIALNALNKMAKEGG